MVWSTRMHFSVFPEFLLWILFRFLPFAWLLFVVDALMALYCTLMNYSRQRHHHNSLFVLSTSSSLVIIPFQYLCVGGPVSTVSSGAKRKQRRPPLGNLAGHNLLS